MKVLFAGLGGIGQRHLRNLRTIRGDSVEVLAWRQRGLKTTLTEQLQVEAGADLEAKYAVRIVPELEPALETADVVFVCNPTRAHVPVALAAARAGCHLFVEKPVSDSWDGIDDLLELVRERRLVTFVGYQLRFHPLVTRLQALVRERAVGNVIAVRAEVGEYLPGWHPYEDYRAMYASRRELGGGVILSQIHELDYLYSLFGLPRRVFALGGHLSRLEVDVEDVASISLEFFTDGHLVPGHLLQDYLQRPPARTCVVVGDAGKITADFNAMTLNRWDEKGDLVETLSLPDYRRNEMFLDELRHFLSCIEMGKSTLIPLSEGVQSLRMALAARDSVETGRVIALTGGASA
jgi:predicted dehydrogenase